LHLNLHAACNIASNKLLKNALTGHPELTGNQSIYSLRQNTMKANAFPMIMMAEAMILMIYG
jgi:hypothetical protein